MRIAILHRFDLVSVHEEAKKMKKTFEKYGHETNLLDYQKSLFIHSKFQPFDLAIFWTAYQKVEVAKLKRFFTSSFAKKIISYYVVEGIAKNMNHLIPLLKQQYIVSPSKFSAECIEKTGVQVRQVIPHQIDEQMEIDEDYGQLWRSKLPPNKKIFVYIGNPIMRKGLIKLRQATDILSKKYKNFHVVIHTGNYPTIQGYNINMLKHHNITLELEFPKASKAQAIAKIKHSDFYVHPAKSEGFGLPILEALQVGKPLVCIDAPAVNEIANPKNSFMTPRIGWTSENYHNLIEFVEAEYDPRDLAYQMELALTSPKEVLENKIAEGYKTIEKFKETYKKFLEI